MAKKVKGINQVYVIDVSTIAGLEIGGQYHWNAITRAVGKEEENLETIASWSSYKAVDNIGELKVLGYGLHKPFELDMNVPVNDVMRYDLELAKG